MPLTIDVRLTGLQSFKVACNVSIASSQWYVLPDKTVMLRKTTQYWRIFREGARRALSHKRDVSNLFRLCYRIRDETSKLFTAV